MPARSAPPGFHRSIAPTRIRLRTCRTPGDGRWRGWRCSPRRSARRWFTHGWSRPLLGLATATLLATLIKCALYGLRLRRLATAVRSARTLVPRACSRIASPSRGCISSSRSPGSGEGCGASSSGPTAHPAERRHAAPACRPGWGPCRSAMRFGCCCRLPVETSVLEPAVG